MISYPRWKIALVAIVVIIGIFLALPNLFGEESALMDRILFLRGELAKSGATLPEGDALRKNVSDFDGKVDAVRKKIVATTEGGAITGEERLREHTDQLYGALLSYEGKPGDYEIAYIDALKRELADVTKEFEQLLATDLTTLNESLKAKGQQSIPPPPPKVAVNENGLGSGAGLNRSGDPEAPGVNIGLPAGFRLLR